MGTKLGLWLFAAFCASAGTVANAAGSSDAGYDWSGPYLGVYAAYGEGLSETSGIIDAHPSDPFGGIHAGYLFDFDQFVLGVEGDASLADLDADIGSGADFVTQDIDNLASVRARIGLPMNKALLFVSGGWAWADTEYGLGFEKDQKVVSGPTVSLGAQYAFSNNFAGRLEYLHYDYGKTSYDLGSSVAVDNSVDVITLGVDFLIH
jgi:outer membrane immunogenic protein